MPRETPHGARVYSFVLPPTHKVRGIRVGCKFFGYLRAQLAERRLYAQWNLKNAGERFIRGIKKMCTRAG